jgi:hypothetical protein
MKKTFFSLLALAALGLASCGKQDGGAGDPNTIIDNNFDTLAGWVPEPQNATLTKEKAHSGLYSLKVDGAHEYSMGYHEQLGKLSQQRFKSINVSAWAFVPAAGSNATLVVAATNPTSTDQKPMLWEGIDLNKEKVYGKWIEIKKTINMPEGALPTTDLTLYLWRTGGDQAVFLDDLHVTINE